MNANVGVRVEATDDVDRLVDTLIADPTKADDVKAALKRRVSETHVVDFRTAVPRSSNGSSDDDDVSDMWDNVPV